MATKRHKKAEGFEPRMNTDGHGWGLVEYGGSGLREDRSDSPDFEDIPAEKLLQSLAALAQSVERRVNIEGVRWEKAFVRKFESGSCAERVNNEEEERDPDQPTDAQGGVALAGLCLLRRRGVHGLTVNLVRAFGEGKNLNRR